MSDRRAQINDGDMSEAAVQAGFRKMADFIAGGGRIVVGINQALDEGFIVGKDGERCLAIKRRATRQDFIETAPASTAEQKAAIEAMHAPFYYELELWDRVLEGADGMRLGIRIRQEGWTRA